jgi:hypothetical protein
MKLLLPIFATVTVILIGTSGYFFKQYKNTQKQIKVLKADPQQANRDLINKIGKLVVLPVGEDPTIATVADPEKLKEQAFFTKAKTGDKVLLYTNAKKAILYNPESNKIVEIAPINIGSATPSPTPTPSPTQSPKK